MNQTLNLLSLAPKQMQIECGCSATATSDAFMHGYCVAEGRKRVHALSAVGCAAPLTKREQSKECLVFS
jgi:hypothetical protein